MGGVCIILNPEMDAAHKLALNKKINLPNDHKYEGRFLGVQLHFKRRDSHGKRIKGTIKTILCSIYHPVDSNEHEEFNGITQSLLNRLPNDTRYNDAALDYLSLNKPTWHHPRHIRFYTLSCCGIKIVKLIPFVPFVACIFHLCKSAIFLM